MPILKPSGFMVLASSCLQRRVSAINSASSCSERSSSSPVCLYGATIKWPALYGNVLSSAKQFRWRMITWFFASSASCDLRQKKHPVSLSPRMSCSRHGAQRCSMPSFIVDYHAYDKPNREGSGKPRWTEPSLRDAVVVYGKRCAAVFPPQTNSRHFEARRATHAGVGV